MGDVAREGRTVILVSHQLNQIRRLCNRVIWVQDGSIQQGGPAHQVVSEYESAMAGGSAKSNVRAERGPKTKARFVGWEIDRSAENDRHTLNSSTTVTIKLTLDVEQPIKAGFHGISLRNQDRQLIWAWATSETFPLTKGRYQFRHTLPGLPIRPGPYQWQVSLYDDGELLELWDCVPEMNVATELHTHPLDEWNGILNIPTQFEWRGE
jgi:lipopolysaccharide transport system ATP-binding protein